MDCGSMLQSIQAVDKKRWIGVSNETVRGGFAPLYIDAPTEVLTASTPLFPSIYLISQNPGAFEGHDLP